MTDEEFKLKGFPETPYLEESFRLNEVGTTEILEAAHARGWMWAVTGPNYVRFLYLPDECAKLQL